MHLNPASGPSDSDFTEIPSEASLSHFPEGKQRRQLPVQRHDLEPGDSLLFWEDARLMWQLPEHSATCSGSDSLDFIGRTLFLLFNNWTDFPFCVSELSAFFF